MARFIVRGHDVEVEDGDVKVYLKKQGISPSEKEQMAVQIIVYLDSEGWVNLTTVPKPKLDFVDPIY